MCVSNSVLGCQHFNRLPSHTLPQLFIKPLCYGEWVNKKSELIFFLDNQRKKEKTTLPNSSALAGAGNSTALLLITGIVCTSRILEWKSLQQLALFFSLSGAVLTTSNKLPLLKSRAFPCSFYTLTINNCVTKPDLVSGQSRKRERSRNSVSISPGGGERS